MSASSTISIGIVGVGKIVRDQHLPALAKNADYQLVATASRNAQRRRRRRAFKTIEEMLGSGPRTRCRFAVHAAAIPLSRPRDTALEAGKHVFLEKPPGATVSEVEDLKALAAGKGVSLFASWHSRYAPAVEAAQSFPRRKSSNGSGDQLEGGRPPLASQPGMDLAGRRARRVRPRHQRAVDRHAHPAEGVVRHRGDARVPGKPRRADRRTDRLQRRGRAGGDG